MTSSRQDHDTQYIKYITKEEMLNICYHTDIGLGELNENSHANSIISRINNYIYQNKSFIDDSLTRLNGRIHKIFTNICNGVFPCDSERQEVLYSLLWNYASKFCIESEKQQICEYIGIEQLYNMIDWNKIFITTYLISCLKRFNKLRESKKSHERGRNIINKRRDNYNERGMKKHKQHHHHNNNNHNHHNNNNNNHHRGGSYKDNHHNNSNYGNKKKKKHKHYH